MKSLARRLAVTMAWVLAAIVILELGLRVAGRPDGRFRFTFVNQPGMYAPNGDFIADWGPFPYRIRTNSLGLRSHEPVVPKPKLRIVTIGDSITDGFFVDNDETYPAQLERALADEHHVIADVQNASRGQASIDKELGILRRVGLALQPDVVVLTFVTNDVSELAGKTRAQLDDGLYGWDEGGVERWLITRTALGEVLFDRALKWRAPRYAQKLDPAHLEGNDDYEHGARVFHRRAQGGDDLILGAKFSDATEALVREYFTLFDRFAATCREHGARLVLVYFPAYSQVYTDEDSFVMRDRLRAECDRLGVAFLDLSEAMRAHGRERPLHFAPADFHLNAAGNALFARTLARFLVERGLVK